MVKEMENKMKYYEIKQPYYALIKAENEEQAQSQYLYLLSEKDCSQFGNTELQFCEISKNRAMKKFKLARCAAKELNKAEARVLLLDSRFF